MRAILPLLFFASIPQLPAQGDAAARPARFDFTIADSTYHMKQYWFVLYSASGGLAIDSLALVRMQEEHLAHQDAQVRRGLIVMSGPFGANAAGWRGLLMYDCDTREEVEGYLLQDPFVKAGRLKYEIFPWWGAVGSSLP